MSVCVDICSRQASREGIVSVCVDICTRQASSDCVDISSTDLAARKERNTDFRAAGVIVVIDA